MSIANSTVHCSMLLPLLHGHDVPTARLHLLNLLNCLELTHNFDPALLVDIVGFMDTVILIVEQGEVTV